MTQRDVLVLSATVGWRQKSCEAMLRSLAAQTLAPSSVILHLDGDTPSPPGPAGLKMTVHHSPVLRGVGNWWRSLDASHLGMLVAFVGDDYVYPPDYLARLVALHATHGGAIAWYGWDHDGREWGYDVATAAPTPLMRCGSSFMIAEAHDLLGVATHELASVFFAPHGHEEALISYWLWRRGISMTRPAGTPGVRALAASADARSTSVRDRDRKHSLRQALRRRYDWPIAIQPTDARVDARVEHDIRAALDAAGRASRTLDRPRRSG
jgi:hypothetical protein